MIVIDANIWIDHFRLSDPHLAELAADRRLRMHPYMIGELALGNFANHAKIIAQLEKLPAANVVSHANLMQFMAVRTLSGTGIGYVDCHLLASTLLMGCKVWTRDKRLANQATRLQINYTPPAGG